MEEIDHIIINFIWQITELLPIDLFQEYSVQLKILVEIFEYITLFAPRKFLSLNNNLQFKFLRICEISINSYDFGLYINSTQAVILFS